MDIRSAASARTVPTPASIAPPAESRLRSKVLIDAMRKSGPSASKRYLQQSRKVGSPALSDASSGAATSSGRNAITSPANVWRQGCWLNHILSNVIDYVHFPGGYEFCWDCGASRSVIVAHDNRWHKPKCRYYTNPADVKEAPTLSSDCPECAKAGGICAFPLDDDYPQSYLDVVGLRLN